MNRSCSWPFIRVKCLGQSKHSFYTVTYLKKRRAFRSKLAHIRMNDARPCFGRHKVFFIFNIIKKANLMRMCSLQWRNILNQIIFIPPILLSPHCQFCQILQRKRPVIFKNFESAIILYPHPQNSLHPLKPSRSKDAVYSNAQTSLL